MTTLITPKILKGTRDFLPEDMAKRNFALKIIRETFERFGYDMIDTPAIEYAETLLGKYGEEGSKLVYQFKDNGKRDIALRYDQTVPFARLIAANWQKLPMPFKRYQVSKVWRADKPARGRYREFTQCDIDFIGTDSPLADAEIAIVIFQTIKDLGFEKFTLTVNDRRIINQIFRNFNVPETEYGFVLRTLDKLEKIGEDAIRKELETRLDSKMVASLLQVLIQRESNEEIMESLASYDCQAFKQFLSFCEAYGMEGKLKIDLSLARGLDYYTGVIFEAAIDDVNVGSVCGGGRYDDLCGMFSKKKFSGTGVAFGFDRLVLAMEELGLLSKVSLSPEVLVINFPETIRDSIKLSKELQSLGINTELYIETAKLTKQMKYANQKGIPFVVIYGEEEQKSDEVTIKIMKTGIQKTIPRVQLGAYLQGFNNVNV